MLWISHSAMKKSFRFSRMDVISNLDQLHIFVCPVNLGTIVFGSFINDSKSLDSKSEAYVFPSNKKMAGKRC